MTRGTRESRRGTIASTDSRQIGVRTKTPIDIATKVAILDGYYKEVHMGSKSLRLFAQQHNIQPKQIRYYLQQEDKLRSSRRSNMIIHDGPKRKGSYKYSVLHDP